MSNRGKHYMVGLTLWVAAMMLAFGESAVPATEEAEIPPYEVAETEIKLPGVTIDRAKLEIRIEATVCLESGILEYVVCKPGTFEHEAIFTTEAKPELVHAALLLCGLKPTPQLLGMTDLWWEKAMKRGESRVKIEVEWEQEGARKRVNLTSMLRSREDTIDHTGVVVPEKQAKGLPTPDAWVFAGSFLQLNEESGERFYAANISGILVGIWPDPSTVIQYGLASGDPYKGEDLGMEIYEERVPKVGTKVKLVFSRHPAPIIKDDPEE